MHLTHPAEFLPADLHAVSCDDELIHAGRNLSKADVFRVGRGAAQFAIKTYQHRPWWVRQTVGRFMIWREARIYERLRGVPGIVEFLGRTDAWSITLRFVNSEPLGELEGRKLPDSLQQQLVKTVRAVHERGVVLLDLHRWDILVNLESEQLWIVDFGAAIKHGGALAQMDEILVDKLRQRFWEGPPPVARGAVGLLWRVHRKLADHWRQLRKQLRRLIHGGHLH